MANLNSLKNRLSAMKSMVQIMSAMKLVASTRYKKLFSYWQASDYYYQNILRSYFWLISQKITDYEKYNDHKLLIVFTSSRGLCGGFNSSLLPLLKKWVESNKTANILVLGNKYRMISKYLSNKDKILEVEDFIKKEAAENPIDGTTSTTKILNLLLSKAEDLANITSKFGEIYCLHNQIISLNRIEPLIKQVFPIVLPEKLDEETKGFCNNTLEIVEPFPRKWLDKLLQEILCAHLYKILLETEVGENIKRMIAMEQSTKNAEEMISDTILARNRLRQAKITKELSEIIAGMEAL